MATQPSKSRFRIFLYRFEILFICFAHPIRPRTAFYGFYVPIYWYRGSFHPVKFLPSVYFFANREVKLQNSAISTLLIPHLTTLRLCLVGTESGLRFQHVQWLDINTWDQGNPREASDYRF